MKQNQEFRWPSWRRVLQALAAVSLVGGFFAPHQWAVTAICIVLLRAEKSQVRKEGRYVR